MDNANYIPHKIAPRAFIVEIITEIDETETTLYLQESRSAATPTSLVKDPLSATAFRNKKAARRARDKWMSTAASNVRALIRGLY